MSMALPSERSFEPLPVSEERSDDRSSDTQMMYASFTESQHSAFGLVPKALLTMTQSEVRNHIFSQSHHAFLHFTTSCTIFC